MKKRISLLMFALAALAVTSCSSPEKMKKEADKVVTSCDPQVLEIRADAIEARYTVVFPEKYFHPKAVLEIAPVLVYEGGEATAEVKLLQGEKVKGNNTVIPKAGGKISQPVKFQYKAGMEASHLELRATLIVGDKRTPFDQPYKIADGANITYKLVNTEGRPTLAPNRYQKVITQTKEAQIKYLVNSATVRPAELSKQEVKELRDFLASVDTDPRKEAKGLAITSAASPEGPEKVNTPLSANRGKTAQSAINSLTRKVKAKVPVNLNSIGEDWEGFRDLVSASDLKDKDLILRVLSMYSDAVVREREIKNMSNVYTILKDRVLPELRRSHLVAQVDWNNYTDSELLEFVNAGNVEGLDVEGLLYAATLVADNNTKVDLYTKAAEKFNDYRAYNNLAYVHLLTNNLSAAKTALSKASNQNDAAVKNNVGVVALREGRMADALKEFTAANNTEASYNLGITAVLNGNYTDALNRFNGANSFNEALACVLTGNVDKATTILANFSDGPSEYLKAVVAARKGNCSNVSTLLQNAYAKTPALKQRAAKDIEFAKCKDNI
jgi:tetratricopeptide (TPR) repeat protein